MPSKYWNQFKHGCIRHTCDASDSLKKLNRNDNHAGPDNSFSITYSLLLPENKNGGIR